LNIGCWIFLLFTFPALAEPATNALPALAPAYGQIPPTFCEQHGTAALIGSLALLAVVSLVVWKLLQPKPPVVMPPELRARLALVKLQGQPEDGKFLSEVSQILRCYVTAAFQLPPGERTTAEFYLALAGNDRIPVELGEAVSRFLRECDERKFSPATNNTPFNATERALELVAQSEKCLLLVGRASSRAESKTSDPSVASPHRLPAP
jgi:hypothetical protein